MQLLLITYLYLGVGTKVIAQQRQIMNMSVSNGEGLYRNTIIGLVHDATVGIDRLYDAILFSSNTSNVKVYSMIDGLRYSIQGLPHLDWRREVALGVYAPSTGTYAFALEKLTDFPPSFDILLRDNLTNIRHDLRQDSTYSFDANTGFDDTRFTLIIQAGNVVAWNGNSWSNNATPTANDSVVIGENYDIMENGQFEMRDLYIAAMATLTVNNGTTLDVPGDLINKGSVVVQAGGSLLTYDGNTIDSTITIIKNTRYADERLSMVGIPIVAKDALLGNELGATVYRYDETIVFEPDNGLNRWLNAGNDILIPGRGYAQQFKKSFSFTGKPNHGSITVDGITHTSAAAGDESMRGWNLVANPYPCAIDPEVFFEANPHLDGQIALWDHPNSGVPDDNSDYLIVNRYGAAAGLNGGRFSGYINSMQGFFVRLTNASIDTSIIFNEEMRVNGNNADTSFFRNNDIENMRITIENTQSHSSNTLVLFSEEATPGLDRLFDAKLFTDNSNRLKIYSKLGNVKLAIQGLPEAFNGDIPLTIEVPKSGKYFVNFNQSNGYKMIDLTLEDFLHAEQRNEVWLEAGSYTDRFVLTKNILHIDDKKQKWVIRSENESLKLKWQGKSEKEVLSISLAGLSGRHAYREYSPSSVIKNQWKVYTGTLKGGVYFLLIKCQDELYIKKILIE